jgi:hypothetical protein
MDLPRRSGAGSTATGWSAAGSEKQAASRKRQAASNKRLTSRSTYGIKPYECTRKKKDYRRPKQAQQDAGLRVQPARDTLQDWQQAGPGAGHHVPRLLCTEGPLPVPERHGRHDEATRKHR